MESKQIQIMRVLKVSLTEAKELIILAGGGLEDAESVVSLLMMGYDSNWIRKIASQNLCLGMKHVCELLKAGFKQEDIIPLNEIVQKNNGFLSVDQLVFQMNKLTKYI